MPARYEQATAAVLNECKVVKVPGWSIVVPHADVARLPGLISGIPHPSLSAHVLTYSAHDYAHAQPVQWRVAQLGAITIGIDFEAPPRTFAATGIGYPVNPVSGLQDRPMTLHTEAGRATGMAIGMTPVGAYALLGLPLAELANACVDLTELLGADARKLVERLGAAGSWAERFRLVDAYLLARLKDGPELTRPVRGAWQRLVASHGQIRIDTLAHEIGWTRQHLRTRFRQQLGLGPKTVARVVRAHRAARMMAQPSPLPWSDIAQSCGYADQAHLNRDFRALTGCTPTDYVPVSPLRFDQV